MGDPDKPKLVFFFDEAHLLFDDAPKALLEKIEQVVRLIRSKGVGVYFVTQNPLDVPELCWASWATASSTPCAPLRRATRRRCARPRRPSAPMRGWTPRRRSPSWGWARRWSRTLDEKGAPTLVERTLIRPPASRLGPATDAERQAILSASTVGARYSKTVDRESAYEMLKRRVEGAATQAEEKPAPRSAGRRSDSPVEAMLKSTMRAAGSQLGRTLIRGIMGTLFGKKGSGRR